jgi:1,4-alpha-glucan branching enzyme
MGSQRVRRRENLEAIAFMKELNEATHRECPGALMIAEESTAWPQVSHPVYAGGLGFDLKWNMGWMHDTLKIFSDRSTVSASATTTRSLSACSTHGARISSFPSLTTRWCI